MNEKIKNLIVIFTFTIGLLLAFFQVNADNFPNQLDFSSSTPNVPFFRWTLGSGFNGTSHSFEIYVSNSQSCYFELALWESNQSDYSNLVKVKDIWGSQNRPYLNGFSGLLATSTDITWQPDKYYLLGMKGFNYPDWLSLGGDCGDSSRTISFKGASSSNVFDYAYMVQQGFYEINFTPYLNLEASSSVSTPENLGQYKSDVLTPIGESATTTESAVSFKALVSGQDNGQVKLQVELRRIDEQFTGNDDGGILTSDLVNSGNEATIWRFGLVDAGYHWRARAVNVNGDTSDWQEFGAVGNTDFVVKTVPLYTQVESDYPSRPDTRRWADLDYGTGYYSTCLNRNDPPSSTIARCGCLITSMVMLGRYYGIENGIDLHNSDPKNINTWLITNHGYTTDGSLYWGKALEYLGVNDNGVKKTKLSFDYYNEPFGSPVIDEYMVQAKPGVAYSKRFGHYFVVDGELKTGNNPEDKTFTLKDPYWYNTKKLNETDDLVNKVRGYNNHFTKVNLFSYLSEPRQISSAIYLYLASPAEILITAPDGKRLGKDPRTGQVYNEIVDGDYTIENPIYSSDDPLNEEEIHDVKVLHIPETLDGNYDIQVIGTDAGAYTLTSMLYGENGDSRSQAVQGNTEENAVTNYNLNFENGNPSGDIKPQDVTPPSTSIHLEGRNIGNNLFISDVKVNLFVDNQTDDSDVFKTEYSFDEGRTWQTYTAPILITENGSYAVYYRSQDLTGNIETAKWQKFRIKKLKPKR